MLEESTWTWKVEKHGVNTPQVDMSVHSCVAHSFGAQPQNYLPTLYVLVLLAGVHMGTTTLN